MAESERLGASFSIDTTDLKAGLSQANKMIRESESEFKSAAAGMDDWTKSEDGLNAKIKSLSEITEIQKKKVNALKAEYQNLIDNGLDPTSREAVELRTKINNEEAALRSNEKELQKQTAALQNVGKESDNAGGKAEKFGDETYAQRFLSMYDDVVTNGVENGYLSANNIPSGGFGVPYHSVEEVICEAPDYGHETTSEAMSYIVWVAAMHDALVADGQISGSNDLKKAWATMEALIPGWSTASGRNTEIKYSSIWKQEKLKADTAEEGDSPSDYPTNQPGVDALNPMFDAFKSAYGSDNGYYLMNWLADVDDWYGFSKGTKGEGKFTFINTFQRGEEESCFETVPAPCLEELKWGMESSDKDNGNGIKAIFNGKDKVPSQYSFTNAPDAEDRAIQAIYFANQHGVDCGEISALAGKMGDQCRNDMFDKYYKEIAKNTKITDASAGMKSKHYLMAWYTAWGGALSASYGDYGWAWQIGCSHSHQFYQNPLAAYALLYDKNINSGMKAKDANADYEESLKRQIEMYLWLQSVEGPFAGGCTNSYKGRYVEYPSDLPTFYDMVFVAHPVYADPGSNHWIGNQVWATQRISELFYKAKKDGSTEIANRCEALMDKLNRRTMVQGFQVKSTANGVYMMPVLDGKTLAEEEFDKLDEEVKQVDKIIKFSSVKDVMTVTQKISELVQQGKN